MKHRKIQFRSNKKNPRRRKKQENLRHEQEVEKIGRDSWIIRNHSNIKLDSKDRVTFLTQSSQHKNIIKH